MPEAMSSSTRTKYYSCDDTAHNTLRQHLQHHCQRSGSPFEAACNHAAREIRRGFICTIFGVLAVQLAATVGVSYAFLGSQFIKSYVILNPWALWATYLTTIVLAVMFEVNKSAHQNYPEGLLYMFGITICSSIVIASVSANYATDVVLTAASLTAGVACCLSVYVLQSKYDFTAFQGCLVATLLVWLGTGIWHATAVHFAQTTDIILTGLVASVFACYIAYDVHRLTERGRYATSPDKNVCVAVNVYTDILNPYQHVLEFKQHYTNDKKQ